MRRSGRLPPAIVATVANATEFKSARHFAAFLGLTPKQYSTGGRQRLGRISKQGDVYIRLPSGPRRNLSGPLCARCRGISLGQTAIGSTPDTNRDRCACQQGGPRHLGASHSRRSLSSAAAADRVIENSRQGCSKRQGEGGDGPSVGPTTQANPLRGMRIEREIQMGAAAGGQSIKASGHWPREQAGHKPATGMTVRSQKRP